MTSKFTREELLNIIYTDHVQCGEASALARMALAAMDSEPVAWTDEEELRDVNVAGIGYLFGIDREANKFADPRRQIMLYRHAQPAPEHPKVLPCSVLLEPGLRFGKGIKTSTMLAALARMAVHESDMAALSPEERAEFQAGIEDFKSLIAQQSVVPDEKPMPNSLSMYAVDAVAAIAEVKGWNACRAAMLAADPQLPDSDPAAVPGKWIPVSERMPEIGDIVLTAMGVVVNVGEMECSAANYRFFTSVISGRELPATHWMPLPAAPKEGKP